MITKTVTYTDYNDKEETETLHFHLTKSRLVDNLELKDELESLQEQFQGDVRELTRDEVKSVLSLVKKIVQLSYGQRSEDGKKFRQNEDIWLDFKDSAVYDAVLWSLFEEPTGAIKFLNGVMPRDLMEQAEAEMAAARPQPQDYLKKTDAPKPVESVAFDDSAVENSVTVSAEETDELEAFRRWKSAQKQQSESTVD